MKLKRYQSIFFLILLMCVSINISAQNSSNDSAGTRYNTFAQGTQAFKAGDYATALEYFNQARAAGNDNPTLIYNQAVTLYKLGRKQHAEQVFTELLTNSKWRDLARYNLGRIAEDRNDNEAAYDWYFKVSQHATNEKLRTLAERKLPGLKKSSEPGSSKAAKSSTASTKKGAVLLSLGAAMDDNATSMADELSRRSSDTRDTYLNALAYAHRYVNGEKGDGIKLYGLAYARRFQNYSAFDATVLGVGSTKEMSLGNTAAELGVRATQASIDAGRLANQYTVSAKLKKPLPLGQAKFDYHTSYFDAASAFAHISGWQHQLQLAWQHSHESLTFEPAIKWQNNQRRDKQSDGNYYSYSPTSISLSMDLKWKVSEDLTLQSAVDRTQSTYSGENRLTDIGGIDKQQQRESTRQNWSLGAKYRLSPNWALKGEYARTNVDDDFDIYSYGKNVFSVKVEGFF